jgi:hypothetical protein
MKDYILISPFLALALLNPHLGIQMYEKSKKAA